MTEKEFYKRIVKGKKDLLQEFINILKRRRIKFCIIGGLAVNAYTEPVVSLDIDVVVGADKIPDLVSLLKDKYKIKTYSNSINISSSSSDLRIQIQTDSRYQGFIEGAVYRNVLGYRLPVAKPEDILQGKIWAVGDRTRRASKRQKDLSDILRLLETKKELTPYITKDLKNKLSL